MDVMNVKKRYAPTGTTYQDPTVTISKFLQPEMAFLSLNWPVGLFAESFVKVSA